MAPQNLEQQSQLQKTVQNDKNIYLTNSKYLNEDLYLIQKIFYYIEDKIEVKSIKKEFEERKAVRTPKYRGQVHNYGKWFSLIISYFLIQSAPTYQQTKIAVVYAIGVFWMQHISSIMHCRPFQTAPVWIRKIDNISIFLFIGVNWYTIGSQILQDDPYWEILITILIILLVLTVTLRSITLYSPRWLISLLALLMGWVSIIALPSIIEKFNVYECTIFALGGLSITLGTICWALQIPHKKQQNFQNSHQSQNLQENQLLVNDEQQQNQDQDLNDKNDIQNKEQQQQGWTPHENFHVGSVLMMFFFYLLLFSLQETHPNGY